MAMDPTLVNFFDGDVAAEHRDAARGDTHARERMRSSFDHIGLAQNAAISSNLINSSDPTMAMMSKLADRTPSTPAMSEPPNPQTVVKGA